MVTNDFPFGYFVKKLLHVALSSASKYMEDDDLWKANCDECIILLLGE